MFLFLYPGTETALRAKPEKAHARDKFPCTGPWGKKDRRHRSASHTHTPGLPFGSSLGSLIFIKGTIWIQQALRTQLEAQRFWISLLISYCPLQYSRHTYKTLTQTSWREFQGVHLIRPLRPLNCCHSYQNSCGEGNEWMKAP